MRHRLRLIRHQGLLALAFAVLVSTVRGDALYSVTGLGPASGGGDYLNTLNPAERADFQSGSFDVFAHPATSGFGDTNFYANQMGWDVAPPANQLDTLYWMTGIWMATENNHGEMAGIAPSKLGRGGTSQP